MSLRAPLNKLRLKYHTGESRYPDKNMQDYAVYILASRNNMVLYTGSTHDLKNRVFEHKEGLAESFTKKYKVQKLVYYEIAEDLDSVLYREKQIKNYSRSKKMALIDRMNPHWDDLYERIQD